MERTGEKNTVFSVCSPSAYAFFCLGQQKAVVMGKQNKKLFSIFHQNPTMKPRITIEAYASKPHSLKVYPLSSAWQLGFFAQPSFSLQIPG
jgi:hypothetical protein